MKAIKITHKTYYPKSNVKVELPIKPILPKKEFLIKFDTPTSNPYYKDSRYDGIFYNAWITNKYDGQSNNSYKIISVFQAKNKSDTVMVKIQFMTGTTLVITYKKYVALNQAIYDPYMLSLYDGTCGIGNIVWNASDPVDDLVNNSYFVWKTIASRVCNVHDAAYSAFGGNGWQFFEFYWRYFEFFYAYNEYLVNSGCLPLLDPNDWRLYKHMFGNMMTDNDKMFVNGLPYPAFLSNPVPLSMRIKDLKFDERYYSVRAHTGRPRGAKNKPKEEPPKEKVQMYRVIDPSKG